MEATAAAILAPLSPSFGVPAIFEPAIVCKLLSDSGVRHCGGDIQRAAELLDRATVAASRPIWPKPQTFEDYGRAIADAAGHLAKLLGYDVALPQSDQARSILAAVRVLRTLGGVPGEDVDGLRTLLAKIACGGEAIVEATAHEPGRTRPFHHAERETLSFIARAYLAATGGAPGVSPTGPGVRFAMKVLDHIRTEAASADVARMTPNAVAAMLRELAKTPPKGG